jgi:hypothetical protein
MVAIPARMPNPSRCRTAAAATANATLDVAIARHENLPKVKPASRLSVIRIIAELNSTHSGGSGRIEN